jgi:hypothetical protein
MGGVEVVSLMFWPAAINQRKIYGTHFFFYSNCIISRPPLWSSGLVVRVPGYRSRGPGLIPGATRFSEK